MGVLVIYILVSCNPAVTLVPTEVPMSIPASTIIPISQTSTQKPLQNNIATLTLIAKDIEITQTPAPTQCPTEMIDFPNRQKIITEGREWLRFNAILTRIASHRLPTGGSQLFWVNDTGEITKETFEMLTKKGGWLLQSDWITHDREFFSDNFVLNSAIWKKCNFELTTAYMNDISSNAVDYMARFGITGAPVGSTLIYVQFWDINSPTPENCNQYGCD